MRAVIQRVSSAVVVSDGVETASIGAGLAILLGVAVGDTEKNCDALAAKTAALRIFCDNNDKMNLSLLDVGGSAAVVSNFTLCADASHGHRPSFTGAALPDTAQPLYLRFIQKLRENGVNDVQTGIFGADMQLSLVNDGPVTIVLDC